VVILDLDNTLLHTKEVPRGQLPQEFEQGKDSQFRPLDKQIHLYEMRLYHWGY